MKLLRTNIWPLIALIFAFTLTLYAIPNFVLRPWHSVPTLFGDGMKNEFTYLYTCMYGRGYWFEGMNYPYGDHIVYTDGVPLLSLLLSAIGHVNVPAALTVLWWFIALSYILSVMYLYRILRSFSVWQPAAVLFAGLITICSPQLFRLAGGHYAFCCMCVVPMLFYYSLRYHLSDSRKYVLYICLVGFAASTVHLYYAALFLLWVALYVAGYMITAKEAARSRLRHVGWLLFSAVAVVVFLKLIISVTDTVNDRPGTPYGLYDVAVHLDDVYYSQYSNLWQSIGKTKIGRKILASAVNDCEAHSYLGIGVLIMILLSVCLGVANKLRGRKNLMIVRQAGFQPVWLLIAVGVLLFLFLMPLIWQVPWLDEHLSFLRQFRTIGRFIWIFYYIATVYGVVVLHIYYERLVAGRKTFAAYALVLAVIVLWGYEAGGYTRTTREVSANAPKMYDNFFSEGKEGWTDFLSAHHLSSSDFQAILMLDFFHIGSEKIWIDGEGSRLANASKASIQLHLPIIDACLSRTSLSQTLRQVKILAGPYVEKPMLKDLNSHKPILMLVYAPVQLNPDEQFLLQAADRVGDFSSCRVYALYPDRLNAISKQYADSISAILPGIHQPDSCVSNTGAWYINHLDGQQSVEHLFGPGAVMHLDKIDSVVANVLISPARDSQEYEFSCWVLLSRKDYKSPYMALQMLDSVGNTITTEYAHSKMSVDSHDMWFRTSVFFRMPATVRSVTIRMIDEFGDGYISFDEIMFRPADALIVSKGTDGSVMVNNHLFRAGGGAN